MTELKTRSQWNLSHHFCWQAAFGANDVITATACILPLVYWLICELSNAFYVCAFPALSPLKIGL